MGIVRFFFGFSWWILLYLSLYAWWLVSVVIWLLMFAQEAKSDGSPPNTPSPGSIMILMVAMGLGLSTAVTLGIGLSIRWSVPLGLLTSVVVSAGVVVLSGYYNLRLAEEQTTSMLYVNVAIAAAVIFGNLLTLFLTLTPARASSAPPPLP